MRESKSNITFYTTITIPETHIISTRWPAKFMFSYLCWICPDPLIMLVPNSTYVITCFMPDLKRKFQFDPNRLKIDSNRLKSTQIDSFRLIDSTIFHWILSKSKLYSICQSIIAKLPIIIPANKIAKSWVDMPILIVTKSIKTLILKEPAGTALT